MIGSAFRVAVAVAAGLFPTIGIADGVSDFYKSKPLTILVGYGPGGGFDITARILARYYGAHIPGNPTVVVENMPGGGGMRVANYLYSVAPKDGSVIGTFIADVAMEPLMGNENAKFSAERFSWIGSMTSDINSCGVWKGAGRGIRTFEDVLKGGTPVIFGSSGPQSVTSKYPLFMKNVLGAPIRVVTGFKGTQDAMLALQRGEIDALCGLQESSVGGAYWSDFQSGNLNIFVQLGMDRKSALFTEATQLSQLVRAKGDDEALQVAEIVFGPHDISRPFAGPPDVPAERLVALRKALIETMADPGMVETGKKIKMDWNPMTGEEVQANLTKYYQTPKAIVAKSVALTKE